MPDEMYSEQQETLYTQTHIATAMTSSPQGDEQALREAEQAVALEWKPGDIVLDLYEVRTVTEGFGEAAQEHPYHSGGFGRVYRVWHRGWLRDMAVKTPRPDAFRTFQQKLNFIQECETWVNLGLHPHIAACHYVRELGGVPRVFSEYADAGTLSQWIRSEKMYEGGRQAALARILDSAIQFAWGLHYAHCSGVVHQDVKPLNALMWHDGTLKVTDFGLASARQQTADADGKDKKDAKPLLVSHGGMTPAYCSPEQAAREKLTTKTDLWSWAVGVLEMFQGEVTWQSGALADASLEVFLKHNGEEAHIPVMPEGIISLLRGCFQKRPEDRPGDMHECALALIEVYRQELGDDYGRTEPLTVADTPDALINRALSFLDLGKAAEGERLFEQALLKDYHNLAATYNCGLLKWRQGHIDDMEVLSSLATVQNDRPNDWRVFWALGQVDLERGDYDSAVKRLEKALYLGGRDDVAAALAEAEQLVGPTKSFQTHFEPHSSPVNALCISPDGALLLSASDRHIIAEEVASGKRAGLFSGHKLAVTAITFSPNGRSAFSASADDTLKHWEVNSGACVRTFEGHAGSVLSAACSPDGRFLLSGGEDKTLKLWEVATGRCLRTFTGHNEAVRAVAFSEDGLLALSGAGDYGESSEDNTVRIWEVATGVQKQVFTGHERYVAAACFLHDGRLILSGSNDHTLRLWEADTGYCVRVFEGHEGGVNALACSPDGRYALAGDEEMALRQWEIVTGRCIRSFSGHRAPVSAVAFGVGGKYAVSGSWDKTIRMWSIGEGVLAANLYTFAVHVDKALERQHKYEAALEDARGALQSGDIATAIEHVRKARSVRGFERTPEVLELCRKIGQNARIRGYRGAWLNRIYAEHTGPVLAAAISPGGQYMVSASGDHTLRIWELETGECAHVLEGHTDAVNSVVYSDDGQFILSGGSDGALRLWNAQTGAFEKSPQGQESAVHAVAMSANGRFVLSGDDEARIKLWDMQSGACRRVFEGHKNRVTSLDFTSDDRMVLSGSWDHTAKIWETRHARCLHSLDEHCGMVDAVCFSPDGRLALSGSWDKKLLLWEVETGRCLRVFEGHAGGINSVAFSPDENYIVSGAGTFVGMKKDDTIRLWEVNTGRCLRTFEGHDAEVRTVAFSPDGRYILSGSADGALMLWEIDWEYAY